MTTEIPTLDFSPFQKDEGVCIGEGATPAQLAFAREIDRACRSHGFVYLSHFGLEPDLYNRVLQQSQCLFRDEHGKSKLPLIDRWTNIGFSPYQSENFVEGQREMDLKESFNLRLHPEIKFDFASCPTGFEETMTELLSILKRASERYAIACALSLGLPLDFFSEVLQQHEKLLLRLNYYPALPGYKDGEEKVRIGAHKDFGAYTFLLLGNEGPSGLEIRCPTRQPEVGATNKSIHDVDDDDDTWRAVEPPLVEDGVVTAIVNTGILLARLTNDEWKATEHRVHVKNSQQSSIHRYSMACFAEPGFNSILQVHDSFLQDGEPPKYPPVSVADFMHERMEVRAKRLTNSNLSTSK